MGIASAFFLMIGLGKASEALGAASIPIWIFAIIGIVHLLKGKFGDTLLTMIAERDREEVGAADPGLVHEVDELRAQVAELQERLDFTERLVTREREVRGLNVGGER
jgi:hypothetical protein